MQACISLGGNMGDVADTFRKTLRQLKNTTGVAHVEASRLYQSVPVGTDAGRPFLNAAATLDTSLTPIELLRLLQQIENSHQRIRETHWGPRTLDLDLILFGDQTVATPELTIPHPHCWYRRFVVDPLAEVAPEARHPEFELSVSQLKDVLYTNDFHIAVRGPDDLLIRLPELNRNFSSEFPGVLLLPFSEANSENSRQIVVSFLAADETPRPFRLRGRVDTAEQFLRDVLSAARGQVTQVANFT
ncbi:MAG: 2-amino-4-hydroxy-6-hydroxymethyldihydropteridine diphosphokinase [Planctomycetota bacterium]|nr:2-amino-4-hydroxy-6-hydroxymethyldihydropteridine diphosphokinase [Planctomycetota bacterium]MDA1247785.1 2-amino-4-hydroxy-6-hydroxymethyldihydropteridine diphosphokinase [Planctomycetota bacterium]